mgnify:CR=1 FL=1
MLSFVRSLILKIILENCLRLWYIVFIKRATANKVVDLQDLEKPTESGQDYKVGFLFSLVVPIYVGKQRDQKVTAQ